MPTLDLTLHEGFNTLVGDTLISENEVTDINGFDPFTELGVVARRLQVVNFVSDIGGTEAEGYILDRYDSD